MSDGTKKVRVGVLFGAKGEEHGVSCLNAGAVLKALDSEKFDIYALGVSTSGQWIKVSNNPKVWCITGRKNKKLPEVKPPLPSNIPVFGKMLVKKQGVNIDLKVGGLDLDVVIPLTNDSTIVGIASSTGVHIVGSNVPAHSITADKHFLKLVASASGLNVPKWLTIDLPLKSTSRTSSKASKAVKIDSDFKFTDSQKASIAELSNNWKSPLFVKPACGGSSIGISKVSSERELLPALQKAASISPKVIIEEFIKAREIECAVLDLPSGLYSSTLGEVKVPDFYSFDAKFLNDDAKFIVNPVMDKANKERLQMLAKDAFKAFEMQDMARVSLFLTSSGKVYLNGINVVPFFGENAIFNKLLTTDGYMLSEVLDTLINKALTR